MNIINALIVIDVVGILAVVGYTAYIYRQLPKDDEEQ